MTQSEAHSAIESNTNIKHLVREKPISGFSVFDTVVLSLFQELYCKSPSSTSHSDQISATVDIETLCNGCLLV